jgi:ligand-binding sensor domain-containing protein
MGERGAVAAAWMAALWLLLAAYAWLPASARAAAAGTPPLRDYALDAWSSRNGLPHNSLRDIAQTPDGHLWFATWEGLVRYNGLEFDVIDRGSKPGLQDNGIGALYVDRDGALWLSDSRGNVGRYGADGRWQFWTRGPDWPKALVHALAMDAEGRMWLLFEGHGLGCIETDGHFRYIPPPPDLPLKTSFPRMVFDGAGRLVIGTLDGLVYREPDGRMHRAPFALPPGLAWPYRAADGTLWVVAGDDIYQVQAERAVLMHHVPGQGHFTAMLQDRQGELWLGTENRGLVRIGSHGVEYLGTGPALPTGRIVSLLEDAEGSIWLGANGGLYRLRETLFSSYTHADGLSGDYARALLEDRDGTLWIGSASGLDRMGADGRIRAVPVRGTLGQEVSVLSLAQDPSGDLWVGTYADGVYRLRNGRVQRHYGEADGIPAGHIRAIVVDAGGDVLLGSQRGVLRIHAGQVRREDAPDLPHSLITALASIDGALWIGSVEGASVLDHGRVRALPLEAMGGARSVFGFRAIGRDVWIATDRGLYRDRGDVLARVGLEQGMPVDTVFQLQPDRLGNVWIPSNRGVLRIGLDNLNAAADGRVALAVERYGEIDGMANSQANGSSAPSIIQRGDGAIWLVTAGGVAAVDPARLQRYRDRPAPPAAVESVQVDGHPFDWQRGQRVPGGSRVSIGFVGLSYLMPERIEYRTRLEGLDGDWIERGRLRSVEFIGLPPGRYVLHVGARHPGGPWSDREATWRFDVAPLWWQRTPVRAAAVVLVLFGLVALYQFLIHRYKRRNACSRPTTRRANC